MMLIGIGDAGVSALFYLFVSFFFLLASKSIRERSKANNESIIICVRIALTYNMCVCVCLCERETQTINVKRSIGRFASKDDFV